MDFVIDAEFIESDRQIELVSLAIVAADGREFYAVSTEFDPAGANDFVQTVVFPLLEPASDPVWMSRAGIRDGLLRLIGDERPQFWSWGGAPYDWIVIAQLFSLPERMPDGWQYTAHDITLLLDQAGLATDPLDSRLPQPPAGLHHALVDARWAQQVFLSVAHFNVRR